ncbi:MAG: monofunctional biosynthetic peptidoglycan transglycosylase [Burkholderiales bacterium]|nr:monofunctional biosynthetic peptidoglycan transglycosylase [Burkholderiales bacterium]
MLVEQAAESFELWRGARPSSRHSRPQLGQDRVWWWRDHNPAATAFMQARLEQLHARDREAKLRHSWVPYDRIAVSLKRAVVVAEDAKFSDHEGFDWEAIEKAREKNRRKGKIVAGGSTISQQLAKNLFLSGERSAWRKGQEALITVMIEHVMDKRRILEIYLNVIEWGEGVFGAEAAARHYYGVGASALGVEQSARLAAMVPNPRFYDRNRNTAFLARRAQTILARMPQTELP